MILLDEFNASFFGVLIFLFVLLIGLFYLSVRLIYHFSPMKNWMEQTVKSKAIRQLILISCAVIITFLFLALQMKYSGKGLLE